MPTSTKARVLVLVCGLPAAASAQATDCVRARHLVRAGSALLTRGDCTRALEQFEQARAICPTNRNIEVSIGTALACLGRSAAAATRLEMFLASEILRSPADGARQRMIDGVQRKALELRRKVARVVATCPDPVPAHLAVDGKESPLRDLAYVEPGFHVLEVACNRGRLKREVQLLAGQDYRLAVTVSELLAAGPSRSTVPDFARVSPNRAAAAVSATPLAPPRSVPVFKRWWFWTIVGAAMIGATVGVVAGTTGGSERLPRGEAGRISLQ